MTDAYGVTKATLTPLRTLDIVPRSHGIPVNAIAHQLMAAAKNKAMFASDIRAGAVEPEAVDIISFLVRQSAAPISGAIVPVYGG